MIIDYLDRFIPEKAKINATEKMRSYVLTGVILSNLIALFLAVFSLLLFIDLPPITHKAALIIFGYSFTSYVIVLIIFQKTGSCRIASNLTIFIFTSIIFACMHISGGFETSPITKLLGLCPVIAFLLTGIHDGIKWLVLIFSASILSFVLGLYDYGYIQLLDEQSYQFMNIGLQFLLFIMIGGGIVIYEAINRLLKRKLIDDGEKFREVAQAALESAVVNESADSLAEAGESLLESTNLQKIAIHELSTTTEELAATADQNTALAASAKASIIKTDNHLQVSREDIIQLINSMDLVKSSSEEIQLINNMINDISYQTNILSLNAMIEASRASEGSGGFKVVALEVKKLAERSANAAESINKLLDENFKSVQNGVLLSETMQQRFNEISDMIQPLSHDIQNISDASVEQNEAIKQITNGLIDIDQAVEHNRGRAKITSNTANQLKENALRLNKIVSAIDVDLDV